MEKETISIYTIAKEAGVSPATVSRVLNGSARVSEEKRARVQALIEKYSFTPNALARGLSSVETKVIGLMVSDIRNPFYATMVVECEKAASEKGYLMMLCNSLGSNEMELTYLEKFNSQRVDAVIQIGGKVDELVSDTGYVQSVNKVASSMPVLITGKLDGADCYQVNIDEGQAMELLISFLIENGHRDIALLGGRDNVKSTVDKRLRYRQMLWKYGIPVREEYIIDGDSYDIESGSEAMRQFMREDHPMPSVVIAINDFTAVGVVRTLREAGYRIPEEISVVSFDNTYIAETCMPRLTCVGYDYRMFGRLLVDTAVCAIHGEEPPRVQMVKSRLVIRDSCKCLND
ncbi:MAG TPA: LacI family transcriptional regulator [Candidatus Eisenbergiella stercorigallinarum]|uniref:LacI family transcriptional regulator n=1 Tax=Candidatus Eisenbergiella stercorigallinarum TaxID=2838557 RepID=A0A9D2U171_9FIRM|nr:LacI family transcriptional regulator [Candidatus Eisenbergiella stercorigallinarum]